MFVVIDSNVITADYRLSSPTTQIFLESFQDGPDTLIIPQLVIDEVVANYHREYRSCVSAIHESITQSRGVFRRKVDLPDENDITSEVHEYRSYLESRLNSFGVVIYGYPTVSHEYIMTRIIGRKRPFADDDEGYRDMLLWQVVLELLEDETLAVLIGADRKAFGSSGKSVLHPDLVEELQVRHSNLAEVDWYESVSDFLVSTAAYAGLSLDEIAVITKSGNLAQSIIDSVKQSLPSILADTTLAVIASDVSIVAHEFRVQMVGDISIEQADIIPLEIDKDNQLLYDTWISAVANIVSYDENPDFVTGARQDNVIKLYADSMLRAMDADSFDLYCIDFSARVLHNIEQRKPTALEILSCSLLGWNGNQLEQIAHTSR